MNERKKEIKKNKHEKKKKIMKIIELKFQEENFFFQKLNLER